jgi:hypothetical protein
MMSDGFSSVRMNGPPHMIYRGFARWGSRPGERPPIATCFQAEHPLMPLPACALEIDHTNREIQAKGSERKRTD